MTLRSRVAELSMEVDSCHFEPLRLATKSGWTRQSTVVQLAGGGCTGAGEDVIYADAAHKALQAAGPPAIPTGHFALGEWFQALDRLDLDQGATAGNRLYRRWAFESAALTLALRQADTDLGAVLDLTPKPVRYVISMGLGSPPTTKPLQAVRELYPNARFKLDLGEQWSEALIEELAELDCVDVVDLKGLYRGGGFEGPPANAKQYRRIAERIPGCWIEDPEWTKETLAALEPHLDRVTWDANQHSLADLLSLRHPPRCINIKPSRYGFVDELLRTYEFCRDQGIACYGGGQFELGPGRQHIQALASLFCADAANDVSPTGFNDAVLRDDLPRSPLPPTAFA